MIDFSFSLIVRISHQKSMNDNLIAPTGGASAAVMKNAEPSLVVTNARYITIIQNKARWVIRRERGVGGGGCHCQHFSTAIFGGSLLEV